MPKPKVTKVCADVDLDNIGEVARFYQDYVEKLAPAHLTRINDRANLQHEIRLLGEFGSLSYEDALLTMQANPSNYIDGRWGFSHAGLVILELQSMKDAGVSEDNVNLRCEELIQRYAVREMVARCKDTLRWRDPLCWNEDSFLDWQMVVKFVEWWKTPNCCDQLKNIVSGMSDGYITFDGTNIITSMEGL